MKKLLRLQSALLRETDIWERLVPERDKYMDWERIHLCSSSKIAYQMAEERGSDPVLTACACACHDYGRIVTGKHVGHAEAGFQPVQEFLRSLDLFAEQEVMQIAIAVKNHSRKEEVHGLLEEIVKDADVLDFYQYGFIPVNEGQKSRLKRILEGQNLIR